MTKQNVTCPYCGKKYSDQRETCPYCGELKPRHHCQWKGLVAAAILLLLAVEGIGWIHTRLVMETLTPETIASELSDPVEEDRCGQAVEAAWEWLEFSARSRAGLIADLQDDGFTAEEAVYGADYCGADWDWQALLCAQEYLDSLPFSRVGLEDQLLYEQFTPEQARYAAEHCGADWMEQAALLADVLREEIPEFTSDDIYEALREEGFTQEEANFGAYEAN